MYTFMAGIICLLRTLHKVLIHRAGIIHSLSLPSSQLSEDVQEARHKDYRHARERYIRKFSRFDTNTDIFHHLILSSDPVISNFRKIQKKN